MTEATTFLNRVWKDPVWSKVIAGVILAAGAGLAAYLLDWWPTISSWPAATISFLQRPLAVPYGLVGLGALAILVCGALGALVIFVALRPEAQAAQQPAWKSFTTGVFEGLRWRWSYRPSGGIYDLALLFELRFSSASVFSNLGRIASHGT